MFKVGFIKNKSFFMYTIPNSPIITIKMMMSTVFVKENANSDKMKIEK